MAPRSAPVPPNGPLEVVFSFDTTNSMYSWLDELRGRIQDMIQRLQADIPGIKMAVFAHGDYDTPAYVTKWIDFTDDIAKLCEFVNTVEITRYGGTYPECYELALRQVRTELSWTPGSRRVLVMMGDDVPHEPKEPCNKDKIDWRAEVKALAQMAVTIYGVRCGSNAYADVFYKNISEGTGGRHLLLADFASLFDTLMAVCYREGNDTAMLANYEKEVRARCTGAGLPADIDAMFSSLRSDGVDATSSVTLKARQSVTSNSTGAAKPAKTSKPSVKQISHQATSKMMPDKNHHSKKQTRKVGSGLNKFKESNLPLLKRENVPENNFSLRSLRWSPWKLAMVGDGHPVIDNNEMWEKRVDLTGYRLKVLPYPKSSSTHHIRRPVLFEVAVQASGGHKKRYVVLSAVSSHGLGVRKWEPRLLGVARSQVDRVLNAGGSVHVRFCVLDTKDRLEMSSRNIRRYDYAWKRLKTPKSCPRDVVKGSLVVSQSD